MPDGSLYLVNTVALKAEGHVPGDFLIGQVTRFTHGFAEDDLYLHVGEVSGGRKEEEEILIGAALKVLTGRTSHGERACAAFKGGKDRNTRGGIPAPGDLTRTGNADAAAAELDGGDGLTLRRGAGEAHLEDGADALEGSTRVGTHLCAGGDDTAQGQFVAEVCGAACADGPGHGELDVGAVKGKLCERIVNVGHIVADDNHVVVGCRLEEAACDVINVLSAFTRSRDIDKGFVLVFKGDGGLFGAGKVYRSP